MSLVEAPIASLDLLEGFSFEEGFERKREVIFGFDPGRKITAGESLFLQEVLPGFLCNGVVAVTADEGILPIEAEGNELVYYRDGKRVKIAEGRDGPHGPILDKDTIRHEHLRDVVEILGTAINGYGDWHLLYTCTGRNFSEALVDVRPRTRLSRILRFQQGILEGLLGLQGDSEEKAAYIGDNHSRGAIGGQRVYQKVDDPVPGRVVKARGYETNQHTHQHLYMLDMKYNNQAPGDIVARRLNVLWDGGPSRSLGEFVVSCQSERLREYCFRNGLGKPEEGADNVGPYWGILGLTPAHYGDIQFMDEVWRPINHTIFAGLCQWHSLLYESELPVVIAHEKAFQAKVQDVRDKKERDRLFMEFLADREEFFRRRRKISNPTPNQKILYDLADAGLNRAAVSGWAGVIQFRISEEGPEGFIAVVINPLDEIECGSVEAMALRLNRKSDYYNLDSKAKQERSEILHDIIYGAVGLKQRGFPINGRVFARTLPLAA